jgi:hypothetical protein
VEAARSSPQPRPSAGGRDCRSAVLARPCCRLGARLRWELGQVAHSRL